MKMFTRATVVRVAFGVLAIHFLSGFSACTSRSETSTTSGTDTSGSGGSSVTHTVGGTVSHLIGTLSLQNNLGDTLSVTGSSFTFPTGVAEAATYSVTVATNPTGQSCTVSSGSGTMGSANVTSVSIDCAFASNGPCDSGVALASTDPMDAARAMDICDGFVSATWSAPINVSSAQTPNSAVTALGTFHVGHGNLTGFGPNVHPLAGSKLLALSSGTARQPTDPGYVSPMASGYNKNYQNFTVNTFGYPAIGDGGYSGFTDPPQSILTTVYDAIELDVDLTVPAGANAFTFDYRSYAGDFPNYVGSGYVDQIGALLTHGALTNSNLLLTDLSNFMNMNARNMTVCASNASISLVCADGPTQLVGTGFDAAGATPWRTTTPISVQPGDAMILRFLVYDAGDSAGDTTVLFDNFRWIAQ